MTMRYSQKQQRAIEAIEYFIPDHVSWDHPTTKLTSYATVGCEQCEEAPDGCSAERAFFMKSEQGKLPKRVHDVGRLVALLWGHRYMALQVAMWTEDFEKGLLRPCDFDNDPLYIKTLAQSCCESTGRKWEV